MDDFRYVLKFHEHRIYMFNVIDCTKKGEFTVLIMLDDLNMQYRRYN